MTILSRGYKMEERLKKSLDHHRLPLYPLLLSDTGRLLNDARVVIQELVKEIEKRTIND